MKNIEEHIRKRRSVRTFNGQEITANNKKLLSDFLEKSKNPFGIPVTFKFLNSKEDGLTCPVVSGTDLYIGGKIKCVPNADAAFGYSFEMMVLYAQSLGIGTVWIGGTMKRSAFEKAMELADDEKMPCVSPLGIPANKMSFRENMMRKAIKADERLPFEALFFKDNFDTPLTKENAGSLLLPLEMVQLAPSAVNKQPWRVIISDNAVHFYLKRSKGFSYDSKLDMQKIDVGIALCHFELSAKSCNLNIIFAQDNPGLISGTDFEYIASYRII